MSVHELSSDDYHADLTGGDPTLSSSIARILLQRTPAHAKAAHPLLADQPIVRKDSAAMAMGTAVHQILLKDDRIEVLDFPDFRTKAAQQARDEVLDQGRTPMLARTWDRANDVADAIRQRVAQLELRPVPFTEGKPEVTLVWEENGAKCRARLDWLTGDRQHIFDLKCTGLSAAPDKWERQLFNSSYDVQADFYCRAAKAVYGTDPSFTWVVAETDPPYEVSVVRLSDEARYQASVKVDTAIAVWKDCLATDRWAGYDTAVYTAHPPAWSRPVETDAWADVDLTGTPF